MRHSTGTPTQAQQRRFELFADIGCMACRLNRWAGHVPAEVHHLVEGGRRLGHDFTVPLCPYHHRGILPYCVGAVESERLFGPSLELAPQAFRERYGSERELLEATNILLARVEELMAEASPCGR